MAWLSTLLDKLLGPTRVAFDDGSSVEYADRESVKYTSPRGLEMEISLYMMKGKLRTLILYAADISRWDPPNDRVVLSDEEKKEIEQRVVDYCAAKKIPLEIDRLARAKEHYG